MSRGSIRVGASGWSYNHWVGDFYPADSKKEEWLGFYAKQFSTVELNRSFHSLPQAETVENWRDETPTKKLKDRRPSVERLLGTVDHLREKLGPLLFQLPPN